MLGTDDIELDAGIGIGAITIGLTAFNDVALLSVIGARLTSRIDSSRLVSFFDFSVFSILVIGFSVLRLGEGDGFASGFDDCFAVDSLESF